MLINEREGTAIQRIRYVMWLEPHVTLTT